jgi:hypothetical protein
LVPESRRNEKGAGVHVGVYPQADSNRKRVLEYAEEFVLTALA